MTVRIAERTWPEVWQVCNWRGRLLVLIDIPVWYLWKKWGL